MRTLRPQHDGTHHAKVHDGLGHEFAHELELGLDLVDGGRLGVSAERRREEAATAERVALGAVG